MAGSTRPSYASWNRPFSVAGSTRPPLRVLEQALLDGWLDHALQVHNLGADRKVRHEAALGVEFLGGEGRAGEVAGGMRWCGA